MSTTERTVRVWARVSVDVPLDDGETVEDALDYFHSDLIYNGLTVDDYGPEVATEEANLYPTAAEDDKEDDA